MKTVADSPFAASAVAECAGNSVPTDRSSR
jgi:hypothetical protein